MKTEYKVTGICNRCGACCRPPLMAQAQMLAPNKKKCKYLFKRRGDSLCEIFKAIETNDVDFLELIPEKDLKYWRSECENYPNPEDPSQMPPRHQVPSICSKVIEVIMDGDSV